MSEWHIKPALTIKSNHAIKAGTIQEEKIKWLMRYIKSLSNGIIIVFPIGGQLFSFLHQKFTGETWCDLAAINGGIKGDDMRITVTEQRRMWSNIEPDDT